jgi:glutaconate CoA-transferase subunit A
MSFHLAPDKVVDLPTAARFVSDGDTIALGGGLSARLPMALVRELLRQGRRGLHVVGSAHGIDVDLLVAAGAIRACQESYVGFEQDLGLAPAYRRAAETGEIELLESCCGTMLNQLRAAALGIPYIPVRGVIGSDILGLHPEYRQVQCPFTGETLIAVPALQPDVALLHAPLGDARGNVHLDQPYVLDEFFARAARNVVVTVERIIPTDELLDVGVTIPAPMISAITAVPHGAHPSSCYPDYAYDRAHLAEYVGAATKGGEMLADYLEHYVLGPPDEESYRAVIGPARLAELGRWSASTETWQELFR